jgi:lambda repressor-like predicted transcriptional regulator
MRRRWIRIVGGVALVAALLGLLAVTTSWAQSPPPAAEQAHPHAPRGWVQAAATALGLTPAELVAQWRAGRSLAQIAAERGVDEATLRQALAGQVRARLDEAVAAGRLSREEADARFARAQHRIEQWIAASPPAAGISRERGPRFRAPGASAGVPPFVGLRGTGVLDTLAGRLGWSGDELRAELRAGRSLADIAAARGIDRAGLLGAISAVARERLDAAVTAGRLTPQQADALLGVVEAFAPDWITRQLPAPRADERPPRAPAGPQGPRGAASPEGQ